MKNQVQSVILFLLLSLGAFGQVKISQMPTFSGNASGSELSFPAVVNGQNVKVPVKTLIGDKLDSLTISSDSSVYTWKNGMPTFVKRLNFLQDQYEKRQSAKAWLDSIRASGITVDGFARIYNPQSGKLVLEYKDGTFHFHQSSGKAGFSNPAANYGAVPSILSVRTRSDSMHNAVRSESINWFEHTANLDTATTVWGKNIYFGTVPLTARLTVRLQGNNSDVPYTWRSDQWSTTAGFKSMLSWGKWSALPGDSIKIATGAGWGAPTNHFLYTDLNNGGIYQHTAGQFINSNSYWQLPTAAGGKINDVIDYYAGGFASGRTGLGSRSFVLFAEETGLANFTNPWGVFIKGTARKNYLAGSLLIGDSSALNQNGNKLYVSGSSKFSGSIFQSTGRTVFGGTDDGSTPFQQTGSATLNHTDYDYLKINYNTTTSNGWGGSENIHVTGKRNGFQRIKISNLATEYGNNAAAGFMMETAAGLSYLRMFHDGTTHFQSSYGDFRIAVGTGKAVKIEGLFNLAASTPPSSASDTIGIDGEVRRDTAGNMYIKFGTTWRKFAGATF